MNNFCRMGALALVTISLSACATVTRGTKQQVEFKSTPEGADMKTSEGFSCVTPCKIKLKRKTAFDAVFTKAGYESATVKVKSKFSGGGAAAGAGNILLGGVIGGVVDGSNGSLNSLMPNPVDVILAPVAEPTIAPATDAVAMDAPVVEPVTEAVPVAVPAADAAPAPAN
ncbi:MAG: hypothetical protein ABI668_03175 [Sphingorhabdus sp.]